MCIACLAATPMMTAPAGEAPDIFPTQAPAPGWLGGEPVGARITWTGCAGIILEYDGTKICFDPFVSNPGIVDTFFRSAKSDRALVERKFGGVSAAFVGHTHWDHAMDVAVVAATNPGAVVYGSKTTTEICRRQGVSDQQVHTVTDGEVVTIGPFTVEAVASQHGIVPIASKIDVIELSGKGMPRAPFRWPRGQVFSYRVAFGGVTFYLHTSAGFEDAPFARQQPVDVVVACLAARQGTPNYVGRLGDQLQPKVFIPCHHDNFLKPVDEPPHPVPRLEWPQFLDDVAALTDKFGTRLVQLVRGVDSAF